MHSINDTHIILSALGSKGDIHPLIGIAHALKYKGAKKVTFLVNDEYKAFIQNHGFCFISTGSKKNQQAFTGNKHLWDNRHDIIKIGWDVLIQKSIESAYQAVEDAYHSGDNIIVIGLQSIYNGALLAAEAFQLPSVHIILSPQLISVHSNRTPPAPLKWYLARKIKESKQVELIQKIRTRNKKRTLKQNYFKEYNAFRISKQLPPIQDLSSSSIFSKHSLQICLFPTWFGMPAEDWPNNLILTGFPLFDGIQKPIPQEVQAFIKKNGPPILFSFGTGYFDTQKLFKIAMKTCDSIGVPALLVGGSPIKNLIQSERHLHTQYVDFQTILPQCTAIVHHGGIGTMAQAIRAGIPQIIRPTAFDQFDNADRIFQLGIGSFILKQKFNTKNLSSILKKIVERSQAIKQQIHYYQRLIQNKQPIEDACNAIEKHLQTPLSLRTLNPLKRAIIQHIEQKGAPKNKKLTRIKTQEAARNKPFRNGNHESVAMICDYYKKPISITQLYQNYPHILSLKHISALLKNQGLSLKIIQCPIESLPLINRPALIQWQNHRFIPMIGFNSETITVCDPLLEQQSYSIHSFAWYYDGIMITIDSDTHT